MLSGIQRVRNILWMTFQGHCLNLGANVRPDRRERCGKLSDWRRVAIWRADCAFFKRVYTGPQKSVIWGHMQCAGANPHRRCRPHAPYRALILGNEAMSCERCDTKILYPIWNLFVAKARTQLAAGVTTTNGRCTFKIAPVCTSTPFFRPLDLVNIRQKHTPPQPPLAVLLARNPQMRLRRDWIIWPAPHDLQRQRYSLL